ncbi:IS630 family transposase [Tolypothrix sp. NIES-4075]|uniref:IS630 family transposase n=1 Tax=Tolypothrix sp. NIES-4075 TaxID=2005459 RepID=UPI001F2AEF9F|nr:IS630 family transposase [Tolypothrix sp. NIES-4075]
MGARIRVFLTREQDKTLLNLRTADVPQKVKDRAEVVRLNAHGWYVEKIAAHFNWTPQTVREVLHKWEKLGIQGLWEKSGRGGKTKYNEEDIIFLEECLKTEPRTYNSLQLAQKLERDRHIKLSPDRLRRVLKKGVIWKRARKSHKGKQDPIVREKKQADLDMLQLAAAAGEIDLKYLDESGFCAWSEPSYTYYHRGEQKHLEQTQRRGRRLSIIGFFQPLISFIYGLVIGGVSRKSYIEMMELEALDAQNIGRMRVIVQDNGPIHRCQQVQQLWSKWERMGLYIFFLPKYCSQMNPIELEWQHLKKDELAGKMFDDELQLAYAVIDGIQTRGEKGNHSTQRIKFNSNSCG